MDTDERWAAAGLPELPEYPEQEATKTEQGLKYDDNKLRTDLLPVGPLEEVAAVMTFGATKYGDRNWANGLDYSRLYGATLRHIWAWWRGADEDPETGLHPLAHAVCNLLFILEFDDTPAKHRHDDRP